MPPEDLGARRSGRSGAPSPTGGAFAHTGAYPHGLRTSTRRHHRIAAWAASRPERAVRCSCILSV